MFVHREVGDDYVFVSIFSIWRANYDRTHRQSFCTGDKWWQQEQEEKQKLIRPVYSCKWCIRNFSFFYLLAIAAVAGGCVICWMLWWEDVHFSHRFFFCKLNHCITLGRGVMNVFVTHSRQLEGEGQWCWKNGNCIIIFSRALWCGQANIYNRIWAQFICGAPIQRLQVAKKDLMLIEIYTVLIFEIHTHFVRFFFNALCSSRSIICMFSNVILCDISFNTTLRRWYDLHKE